MNFFQHLGSQQVVLQAREREVEIEQETDEYLNQMYWDQISPPEPLDEVGTTVAEEETETNIHCGNIPTDMKRQYFDYNNFYRLKHIKSEMKKPLETTIGEPHSGIAHLHSPDSSICRASDSIDDSKDKSKINRAYKKVVVRCGSKDSAKKRLFKEDSNISRRLLKLKYSSLDSCQGTIDSKGLSERSTAEEHRPSVFGASLVRDNFGRRGTVSTVRDSLTLAHKKVSSASKISLPKKSIFDPLRASLAVGHKDSYTLIFNKKVERFLSDQESISQLSSVSQTFNVKHIHSSKKIQSKEYSTAEIEDFSILSPATLTLAKEKTFESVSYNINHSFKYDGKSSTQTDKLEHNQNYFFSSNDYNIDTEKSFLNHRNSREIILRRMAPKSGNQSVGTQTTTED